MQFGSFLKFTETLNDLQDLLKISQNLLGGYSCKAQLLATEL